MSGVHKNPTISFRISDYERREIEARIKASGMMKKTFFTRCCIYGRICVVGKKETVYMLVQTLEKMQADIHKMYDEIIEIGQIKEKESPVDGGIYTDIEICWMEQSISGRNSGFPDGNRESHGR